MVRRSDEGRSATQKLDFLRSRQYWEIDYSRLYEIITSSDLEDLEAFVRQVSLFIEDKH